ncbi:MAG: hypothetical protein WCW77_04830 [Patescibacteria group bacterium]|jgi:hypothetical protein
MAGNQKRPVDELASKSFSRLGKIKITTWKGVFLIAFVAGVIGTFAFVLSGDNFGIYTSSEAKVSNVQPTVARPVTGGRDVNTPTKDRTACNIDKDCKGIICPMVVGGDKPKCDLKTKACYCGGKCGDKYCDLAEKRDDTCKEDCGNSYIESFENSFGGWEPKHQIACENDPFPCFFDWSIKRSKQKAYDGAYSLAAYLDGSHDDGTIWVEHPYTVTPNSKINCEISFYLWSENKSSINQWPVLAYVGPRNPVREEDFKLIGRTDEVAGWKKYSYSTQLTTDSFTDKIWVAFGFGATAEFQHTYYLDQVSVSFK